MSSTRMVRVFMSCIVGVFGVVGVANAYPGSTKEAKSTAGKDIVATAVAAGNFTTLAKALTEAGLVPTLQGTGPFTVFAPTDAAFAKLPPGELEKLLANKEKLAEVLKYHVVAGKVTASEVTKLSSAKTVEGDSITISTTSGVKVDNATVTATDIMASNGVIHVIDTVLMPKATM